MQVDVTVNSPVSGTIIELYAEVDSTVTVGANLFKVELGDAPKEGKFKHVINLVCMTICPFVKVFIYISLFKALLLPALPQKPPLHRKKNLKHRT